MDEDKIIHALESVGLSKNEVIVYLDLIKIGKSSPIDISKRTGLHRSNTYDILENLLKKGIVDQSIENEKKFFYPIEPKDLLDYIKQKQYELREIIPEIEKIQNKPKEETKVTISRGANSVKNILLHLFDCHDLICIYGTSKEPVEMFGAFIDEFHKMRIKKKIPLKRIHGINAIKRARELNSMEFTETRYLPLGDHKISTNICGSKVVIILWEIPVSAIVIENKEIAETYKNSFDMLWEEAQPVS